jgi:hypothetical protein
MTQDVRKQHNLPLGTRVGGMTMMEFARTLKS